MAAPSSAEGVPPPSRAELAVLAPRELKARARECGVSEVSLGAALLQFDDSFLDANEALIALILERYAPSGRQHFLCVKKSQIRAGFEMDSAKCGVMEVGTQVRCQLCSAVVLLLLLQSLTRSGYC